MIDRIEFQTDPETRYVYYDSNVDSVIVGHNTRHLLYDPMTKGSNDFVAFTREEWARIIAFFPLSAKS